MVLGGNSNDFNIRQNYFNGNKNQQFVSQQSQINNGILTFQPEIKFKKLAFYEVIHEIMRVIIHR